MSQRADIALVDRGFFESRAKARALRPLRCREPPAARRAAHARRGAAPSFSSSSSLAAGSSPSAARARPAAATAASGAAASSARSTSRRAGAAEEFCRGSAEHLTGRRRAAAAGRAACASRAVSGASSDDAIRRALSERTGQVRWVLPQRGPLLRARRVRSRTQPASWPHASWQPRLQRAAACCSPQRARRCATHAATAWCAAPRATALQLHERSWVIARLTLCRPPLLARARFRRLSTRRRWSAAPRRFAKSTPQQTRKRCARLAGARCGQSRVAGRLRGCVTARGV
jgi:hypothetical protein